MAFMASLLGAWGDERRQQTRISYISYHDILSDCPRPSLADHWKITIAPRRPRKMRNGRLKCPSTKKARNAMDASGFPIFRLGSKPPPQRSFRNLARPMTESEYRISPISASLALQYVGNSVKVTSFLRGYPRRNVSSAQKDVPLPYDYIRACTSSLSQPHFA